MWGVTPNPERARRLRKAFLTLVGLGAAFALLYAGAVPCVFARVLHLPCPACGSTRAVLAFVRGDLDGVFRTNPLGPVAAVLLGVFAVQAVASVVRRGDFQAVGEGRIGAISKRALAAVVALEIALWIARFFGAFGGPVPV
jgi:hypothetical protein